VHIHFIGGAHEVGGSCTLLDIDGLRILVDAGLRLGAGEADRLPDLATLQQAGSLDAILVTHAHADHIGALPLVHLAYPQVPLYASEATCALTRIMLADALKIMESRWIQEQEIPLYPEHAVESMLSRMKSVPLNHPLDLAGGSCQVTFRLAGHVLGACSVQLDTAHGRLFFTGDYSIDPQRTVDPFLSPRVRPDVVISEATYGNRLHANRTAEEERLARNVAQVVEQQGKVLIPAFALGRAQEVLLVLLQAQQKGTIPSFPLYVDGMVRTVCQAYGRLRPFLARRLRKSLGPRANPFFFEGSPIQPVPSHQRPAIVEGPPCCIISSSGMLSGGPSPWYAEQLAADPKNAIFLTGYQDEESPGAALLALADAQLPERVLKLGKRSIPLACQVARYNLSAHADAAQIGSLLARLAPDQVYLVHGDTQAREALATSLSRLQVQLPANGQSYTLKYRSTLTPPPATAATAATGTPHFQNLEQLRQHLLQQGQVLRLYTPQELAAYLYPQPTPEDLQQLTLQLRLSSGFQADPRQLGSFRIVPQRDPAHRHDPLPLQQARDEIGDLPELLSLGWRPETQELLLYVPFPQGFLQRHAARLQQLSHKNYKVLAKDTARHLAEQARALLPVGARLTSHPSFFPDGRVRLRVRFGKASDEVRQRYRDSLLELTGLSLDIEEIHDPSSEPRRDEHGRLELNQATSRIRNDLAEVHLTVYRCSLKTTPEPHLELALLVPWLAQPHGERLQRLSQETGYPLHIASGGQQKELNLLLQQLLPKGYKPSQPPHYDWQQRTVTVRLPRPLPPEVQAQLQQALAQQTGLSLQLKQARK
jgi:Cft2 family RNA processing exonuclease